MKALTVCQPHAAALLGPKPVENRGWFCRHRGLLVIHAGKSRDWLDSLTDEQLATWPDYDPATLVFGALIGVVLVTDCERYEGRLQQGPFASGPWCIRRHNPIALPKPIPWRGQLGLFDVPDEIIREQLPDLKDPYQGPPKTLPAWQRTESL